MSDEDWAKACIADWEDGIGKDLVSKPKRRCQRVFIPKESDPSPGTRGWIGTHDTSTTAGTTRAIGPIDN